MSSEPFSRIEELIGREISHYKITRLIGTGGMGVVYEGIDLALSRAVAIKVVSRTEAGVPGAKRRLRKEAQAAAAISHPNIAHVYEIGESESLNYIVMELVQGEPLDRKFKHRSLEEHTALDLTIQVVSALEAAHARHIIHRDIKPSNIMVTADGHVKVLDFGLAKSTAATSPEELSATVTRPGLILGSVQYMSPEQALGEVVDERTDLFSVGAVIYELVTGAAAFQGQTATEILAKVMQVPPDAISRYTHAVSPELERIIQKCLEKDKNRRYQSATELLLDLNNLKRDLDRGGSGRVTRLSLPDRRWLLKASGGVGALAVAAFAFKAARSSSATLDRLAVLPFLNLTGDAQLDYLSEGLTDNLINQLSQLKEVVVRPRNSVAGYREPYRRGELNLHEVGNKLNVRGVLTGRIAKEAEMIVVSAELTDVEADRQLWGDRFRQAMSSIFLAQEQLAREIASKLNVRISPEERARLQRRPTENSDAQHAYLKGRYFWNKRTVEDIKKAIEFFNTAIEKDPKFALAHAGLADSYMMLGNAVHPRDVFPRAHAAAQKAIELDSAAAEPYATLGYVALHYDWNWAQSESSFRAALSLNPNYPTAHSMYARYLSVMGRSDEALVEMRRALELDPLALGISTGIGLCYYLDRKYDAAIDQLKRTLEVESRFTLARFNLGRSYTQKRMYKEAIAEFQAGLKISPSDAGALSEFAYAYARANQPGEARQILRSVTELATKRYVAPYFPALVHAGLGENKEAIQLLEQAFNDRSSPMVFLKTDPQWDSLRGEAGFQSILEKMALK